MLTQSQRRYPYVIAWYRTTMGPIHEHAKLTRVRSLVEARERVFAARGCEWQRAVVFGRNRLLGGTTMITPDHIVWTCAL